MFSALSRTSGFVEWKMLKKWIPSGKEIGGLFHGS
jgi:hypothetical protein